MDIFAKLESIIGLFSSTIPTILGLISQGLQAARTNDTATLDALHEKALAMEALLKPEGV